MLNVKWALRSAWFLNTNRTNRTNLWLLTEFFVFPQISQIFTDFWLLTEFFVFPQITQIFTDFWLLTESLLVNHGENRCVQRRESVQICEICGRLFLNHNAKIQHFILPTHRCSPLLTDTHRFSLINIRALPNGRKYRILAGDWTPWCSWCIHSS